MDRDARLAFAATAPSDVGLRRMARAIGGPRARVESVRRLTGGVDSSTHAISLDHGGTVVLKRAFGSDPTHLAAEADRLTFALDVDVPSPEPIALDADGDWFGRPALVITHLPGRVTCQRQPGPWLDELVQTLGAIHRHPIGRDTPVALLAPHAGLEWRPAGPSQLRRTVRVERLLEIAQTMQSDLPRTSRQHRLLHHDLYHRNVLWQRGRITGVVDWNEARLGPPVCEVAYCSVDIAMTAGVVTSDRFVERYEGLVGAVPDIRRWQALWIAAQIPWLHLWHAALRPKQASYLTVPRLRARLRSLADVVIESEVRTPTGNRARRPMSARD